MRFRSSAGKPPRIIRQALLPHTKERVLAWTRLLDGEILVVGTRALHAIVDEDGVGRVRLRRGWHLVDAGTFDAESDVLRVSWVDGEDPERWPMDISSPGVSDVLRSVRERVESSVVLTEWISFGPDLTARVVIRRNLSTNTLVCQRLLGRGVDLAEPGVQRQIAAVERGLKEQVGLL